MVADPLTTGLLGLGAMFVLILLQVPVGVAMGVVGVVGTGLIIGFGPALTLLATEPSAANSEAHNPGTTCIPAGPAYINS